MDRALPRGSAVHSPPSVQETQETRVPPQGQEEPLEEGVAAHSSVPAWTVLRTEELGGL